MTEFINKKDAINTIKAIDTNIIPFAKAKEYVLDNTDDIRDMADNFGTSAADIGEHFMDDDW